MVMKLDLVGKKIGRLTVLTPDVDRNLENKRRTFWICKCDCGNIKSITRDNLIRKDRLTKSCGCIHKENISIGAINRFRGEYGVSTFKSIYRGYKKGAEARDYDFNLTESEFKLITSTNCHYCNDVPRKRTVNNCYGHIYMSGIDRVDNSKGYSLDNCVPCCTVCNRAKSNMSYEDFTNWLNNITKFRSEC